MPHIEIKDGIINYDNASLIILYLKRMIYDEDYKEIYNIENLIQKGKIQNEGLAVHISTLISMINITIRNIDPEKLKLSEHNYLFNQVIEYNEEEAINHSKKHEDFNPENTKSKYKLYEIKVEKLFKTLKEKFDLNRINIGSHFADIYIFKIARIGISREETYTDYLKVCVIPNTNKIISLYPIDVTEIVTYKEIIEIDREELLETDNKVKTRRISQIEKFNNRYSTK